MDKQDTIQVSDKEDNGSGSLNGKVPNKNLTANEDTFGTSVNNSTAINDNRLSDTHTKTIKEENKVNADDISINGTYLEDNKLDKNAGYEKNNSQPNDQIPKQLKLSDELGEEMECYICIDYVYQCVTLIPCLHNFCAACFSDWMRKSDACPQCRKEVVEVKKNAAINNMVEKFLAAHPEKKRSAQEYAAMDSLNKITQNRIIFKPALSNTAGSKKKKDPEEKKDDGNTCLECRTATDNFNCSGNNKAHLTCTACQRLFPDRRDQYSQECNLSVVENNFCLLSK